MGIMSTVLFSAGVVAQVMHTLRRFKPLGLGTMVPVIALLTWVCHGVAMEQYYTKVYDDRTRKRPLSCLVWLFASIVYDSTQTSRFGHHGNEEAM